MGLLTIGAFSRLSRLSPKALRLYDELGLLRPAYVDPSSGYRFYDPGQLEQARLVAWLRQLGMPLARIQLVTALAPAAAAGAVAAYWRQCEAETASRRDLATFLVSYLSGKDQPTMTGAPGALGLRYAAGSDIGLQRERNEDAAYAGARLLAVADGFGGSWGGDPASAAVIDALRPLEQGTTPGDLLNALEQAVWHANEALPGPVQDDDSSSSVGTTLTAMLWSGSQLALVHIGDSRACLLRDQKLFQITHDHTYVQSLVDQGRLSPDEAASHPQRALLLRALDGSRQPQLDLSLHQAAAGDRYLLCSDGLSAVVDITVVREVLVTSPSPGLAVRGLIEAAHECGGPDNVACVVADVVDLAAAGTS